MSREDGKHSEIPVRVPSGTGDEDAASDQAELGWGEEGEEAEA